MTARNDTHSCSLGQLPIPIRPPTRPASSSPKDNRKPAMSKAALFADAAQAASYAAHRPCYPAALFEAILARVSGHSLAVDVATGSGQAAVALAASFEQVIAQDGSQAQLDHADRDSAANITYQLADAHDTTLPAGCADLVTVAQALHWFDTPRFYAEVRRILKPGGVLAAWTYGVPVIEHAQHPAQAALLQLYAGTLGPYWDARRKLVESGYAGIEPAVPDDFGAVSRQTLPCRRAMSVDDVMGYLRSWSAYQTYRRQRPAEPDPLVGFREQLLAVLGNSEGSATQLSVDFPITLLLCSEPTPCQ